MKGIDISHHNQVTDWKKVKDSGYEFCFIKCTQGTTYIDPTFKGRKQKIRDTGMLLGLYHFAGNQSGSIAIPADPIKEADHFLKNVGDLKEGEIVILDYETNQLADPATWCLAWLKKVEEKLGFKPLLYTYHALLVKYNWKKVSDNNTGLWAARYSIFKPSTGSWPFYMCWQYTSKGNVNGIVGNVDINKTDLNLETLKKYGNQALVETCKKCVIHCPQV